MSIVVLRLLTRYTFRLTDPFTVHDPHPPHNDWSKRVDTFLVGPQSQQFPTPHLWTTFETGTIDRWDVGRIEEE